ncbi:hypothetical protein NKH93_26530 [Mesorhizobium sp. M0954]|uniref:hypothetical protein n=1 Tax=Mesorhizobium sp. M0954 TaxID=2957032 RepID=UPI00333DE5C2
MIFETGPERPPPGSSTCRSCGPNIYQWPELAALSILFRERLVYSFESRPRLFDIISRSIEGVAGLILGRRRGLAGRCALTRPGWISDLRLPIRPAHGLAGEVR